MAYIGFARSPYNPTKTHEAVLEELKRLGFKVTFSKHHWMGDAPFGLIIAETNRGDVAIRWSLGNEFNLRLEEVDKEDQEEFIEDTLEYLSGD